jgi:hypothetical protein
MTAVNFSDPVEVAARTAYMEGRSGGVAGMQSVLNVACNRAAHPSWWGHDLLTVLLDPWQFSCWNPHTVGILADRNYVAGITATASDPDYEIALGLAKQAVAGGLHDITYGADSYFDESLPRAPPWAERAAFCTTIGGQFFYRVQLAPPETPDDPQAPNLSSAKAVKDILAAHAPPPAPPETIKASTTAAADPAPAEDAAIPHPPKAGETADDLNAQELARLAGERDAS